MRLGPITITLLSALSSCTEPSAAPPEPAPAAVPTPADAPRSAQADGPGDPSVVAEQAPSAAASDPPAEPDASDTPPGGEEDEPAVAGPTFSVIARLVDAGKSVPHCGHMHFKVVMKYAVLEVVDGAFEPTTLYAAVSCPEMPPTKTRGFAWTVGETYRLKLRTAGVRRQGAKVDAFEDEPGKRYELLHIDPVAVP